MVNLRPRASLGRVLDDLGSTLLDLVAGTPDEGPEIGGVAIHDPLDDPVLPTGALVLGVGVETPEAVVALLGELGRQGATGLVLREPVEVTDEVRRAAERTGVALLALRRGAPWTHLATMLRSLLAEDDIAIAGSESLGGLPSGDLFAVANAISSLLDAPVTIEDRRSRVLAFSGRQDEADPSRVETILGRQVPERYARVLTERGVFRDLHRSDRPVYVTPIPMEGDTFTRPRVAVAVRAGDEVLGSIWAAVHGPLSVERTEALCDAAKLVALHLLRVRAGSDVQRRLHIDLLSTALEGGVPAREALDRLGLGGQHLMVLGVAVAGPLVGDGDDDAVIAHERERLGDAFAMHLSAVHPKSAAALIGGVAYGLVPLSGSVDGAEEPALRIAQDFLDRVGDRHHAVVGVGPTASDVAPLALSRACVDRVLRVLRDGREGRRAARLADVQTEALMLEMRDIMATRGDRVEGPLVRLMAYDDLHHTNLQETLQAWLEAFGDVAAAAEGLYVHANTFRYRLRRVIEVGEVDLADPDVRFGLLLQLRLVRPARRPSPGG